MQLKFLDNALLKPLNIFFWEVILLTVILSGSIIFPYEIVYVSTSMILGTALVLIKYFENKRNAKVLGVISLLIIMIMVTGLLEKIWFATHASIYSFNMNLFRILLVTCIYFMGYPFVNLYKKNHKLYEK